MTESTKKGKRMNNDDNTRPTPIPADTIDVESLLPAPGGPTHIDLKSGTAVRALKSTDVEGVLAEAKALGGGIFVLPSNFGKAKKPKAAKAKKPAK
jgi:hypothetical protein